MSSNDCDAQVTSWLKITTGLVQETARILPPSVSLNMEVGTHIRVAVDFSYSSRLRRINLFPMDLNIYGI